MTPELSNLNLSLMKSQAAKWALKSSKIEKITLHCFEPTKLRSPEGPFYAVLFWVAQDVDVNTVPWMDPKNDPDGKPTRGKVKKQYRDQDGKTDREKIWDHPLYGLWNLFWELSAQESKERGGFYSFYRTEFIIRENIRPDDDCFRPHWFIMLLNVGDEHVFDLGGIYQDLDNTDGGSSVLFSRKAAVRHEDATTMQTLMSVKLSVPETKDNHPDTFSLKLEPLKVYAKRWVNKIRDKLPGVPVERITLYHYSSPYEIRREQHPVKYCIVFDIPGEILPDPETADSHIDKIISGDRSIYDLLECYQTIHNQDPYLSLIDAGFSDVYFHKPDENFKGEWVFFTRRLAEGNQGVMSQEPCWVLFDLKSMTEKPQQMRAVAVDQSAAPRSLTADRAMSPEQTDPETFIRSLQISYLDDTEVTILCKGKRKNYNCDSIGFRDSKTDEWKTFLEILKAVDNEYRDHTYRLGPAYYTDKETQQKARVGKYDSKLKLLQEISKKLLLFLAKQYNIGFPTRFKLYERKHTEGSGVYCFKFRIPSHKPSYKTKDQALSRLQMLIQNGASKEAISDASLTALEAGATKDEVSKIVDDWRHLQPEESEIADEQEGTDADEDKE